MDDNKSKQETYGLYRAIFLVLFYGLFSPVLAKAAQPREIDIYVGETEILPYGGVQRVSVGDGQYLNVKVLKDAKQILLMARKIGVTDLRVWLESGAKVHYLVRVVNRPVNAELKQVREYIKDIEGVRARVVGDKIILEGNSLRASDVAKINLVTKQFQNVISYVTSGGVTLHGMVFMDVKVVEVNKKEFRKIGVDWENSLNGPVFSQFGDFKTNPYYRSTTVPGSSFAAIPSKVGNLNPYFGISTTITSVINLLEQNGYARSLAEPKLTCKSGGEAKFTAGGQLPIPMRDSFGNVSVDFKNYGVILEMKPVSDTEGYVSTHVKVEVSSIDPTVTVLGIPGFLTRRTETDMNLKQGQTMVISGLLNNSASKNVEKLPGLGNLPVLGELFKSRDFRTDETELIVLVTPTLIYPDHKINRQMVNRATQMQKQGNRDLRFKLMD